MPDEALYNYFLWFPRTDGDGALVVNATQAEQSSPPIASPEFVRDLAKTFRLKGRAVGLDVVPCRTSYFGEEDADDWRDRWAITWRLRLRLKPPLKAPPRLKDEMIGTQAFDPAGMDEPEPDSFRCLIIADFQSAADADRCREAIGSARFPPLRNRAKLDSPYFERVILTEEIVQEQIDLGPLSAKAFRSPPKYISEVAEACRAHGGIVSHEERIAERDEAYDPDGLE